MNRFLLLTMAVTFLALSFTSVYSAPCKGDCSSEEDVEDAGECDDSQNVGDKCGNSPGKTCQEIKCDEDSDDCELVCLSTIANPGK